MKNLGSLQSIDTMRWRTAWVIYLHPKIWRPAAVKRLKRNRYEIHLKNVYCGSSSDRPECISGTKWRVLFKIIDRCCLEEMYELVWVRQSLTDLYHGEGIRIYSCRLWFCLAGTTNEMQTAESFLWESLWISSSFIANGIERALHRKAVSAICWTSLLPAFHKCPVVNWFCRFEEKSWRTRGKSKVFLCRSNSSTI